MEALEGSVSGGYRHLAPEAGEDADPASLRNPARSSRRSAPRSSRPSSRPRSAADGKSASRRSTGAPSVVYAWCSRATRRAPRPPSSTGCPGSCFAIPGRGVPGPLAQDHRGPADRPRRGGGARRAETRQPPAGAGGPLPTGGGDPPRSRTGTRPDRRGGRRPPGRRAPTLENPTFSELTETLRGDDWHVLHYMGHGAFDPHASQSVLVLPAPDGTSTRLSAERLAQVVRDVESLRLVVLNACDTGRTPGSDEQPFTGLAHALVRGGVPAVIAMQLPIPDRAAIEIVAPSTGAWRTARRWTRRWPRPGSPSTPPRRPATSVPGRSRSCSSAGRTSRSFDRRGRAGQAEVTGGILNGPWARRAALGALLLVAAAVIALFFVDAPWAWVEMEAEATRVSFVLSTDQPIVDTFDLLELAAADLEAFRRPDPETGADRTVTLTTGRPAGSRTPGRRGVDRRPGHRSPLPGPRLSPRGNPCRDHPDRTAGAAPVARLPHRDPVELRARRHRVVRARGPPASDSRRLSARAARRRRQPGDDPAWRPPRPRSRFAGRGEPSSLCRSTSTTSLQRDPRTGHAGVDVDPRGVDAPGRQPRARAARRRPARSGRGRALPGDLLRGSARPADRALSRRGAPGPRLPRSSRRRDHDRARRRAGRPDAHLEPDPLGPAPGRGLDTLLAFLGFLGQVGGLWRWGAQKRTARPAESDPRDH